MTMSPSFTFAGLLLAAVVHAECEFPSPLSKPFMTALEASGSRVGDVGNYDGCVAMKGYRFCELIIQNEYRNASILTNGACVPEGCTAADLTSENPSVSAFVLSLQPIFVGVFKLPYEFVFPAIGGGGWGHDANAVLAVLFILAGFLAAGTILDIWETYKDDIFPKSTTPLPTDSHTAPLLGEEAAEEVEGRVKTIELGAPVQEPSSKKSAKPMWSQILLAFSLIHNTSRLFSVNAERGGRTSALNGIRVLSMAMVILGHTVYWQLTTGGPTNLGDVVPPSGALSHWTFDLISSAPFSVDSFFCLSGFLASLAMFRRMDSLSGSFLPQIPVLYLHRYLRLTPALLLVIFVATYIIPHAASGPLWHLYPAEFEGCRSKWWASMLYVNNIVPWSQPNQCLGVTWYLGIDMQLFLILPWLCVVCYQSPWAGIATIAVLSLLSMALLAYYAKVNLYYQLGDYSGTIGTGNYQARVYYASYFRFIPYFIGTLTAMAWRKILAVSRPLTRKQRFIPAAAALLLLIVTFYSPSIGKYYHHLVPQWTQAAQVAYTTLSRPAWAIGLCTLCLYFFTTPKDPFSRFLSMGLWEPLSRLTFGAYLSHSIIISVFYYSQGQLPRYSTINTAVLFPGFWLLAYGFAAVIFLVAEKPMMNLEAIAFKKLGWM